jgi:hypothetical protein
MLTLHQLNTDLCIVGGGMAGVCAALAAARNGCRVVLVQDRSVLGGNASGEIRMHIVGADFHGFRPGARETGIIEELRLEDAARNPQRSYSQWDLLLYEKIIAEPLITLLLDTDCTAADVVEGRITAITALRNSTEDEFHITARFFADCSGDGRLGCEAGADFRMGREARSEFDESLAPEVADCDTLGSSILLTAPRHETPQPFTAPDWVRKFSKEDFRFRPIHSYEYGYWFAEWGGHLDTIKDNARIRHELLRIALGIWNYVKNSGVHPDSSHWALDWVGVVPGKRESRRFLGRHILTEQDVMSGRIFDDAVAYGGWPIDLHPAQGIDAPDEPPCEHHLLQYLYTIPLGSLCSRNVPNLLFAGRNISATHVAFATTRVMATCAVMGQAVGTAAAIAIEGCHASTADIPVAAVQQRLLRDDAFLPGVEPADAADLARSAEVRASSEATPARNAITGYARDLHPEWGQDWAAHSQYHWSSDDELPAWIELSWPQPVTIRDIHLTFDSGLHRELMLTASDHCNSKIIRGAQPEIVRDYVIELDGSTTIEVQENILRKRVHRLDEARPVRSLRVRIHATHGAAAARLFEIRLYGP